MLIIYNNAELKTQNKITTSHILMQCKMLNSSTDAFTFFEIQYLQSKFDQVEGNVRSVACDGLLWGASKLVPIGYGIKKLQINCVIEDDKVRFVVNSLLFLRINTVSPQSEFTSNCYTCVNYWFIASVSCQDCRIY